MTAPNTHGGLSMGYDMRIEAPTDALLAKKEPGEAAYEAMNQAYREHGRDSEQGKAAWEAWKVLYDSPDYDPTYFRLSIWGMSRYRGYMHELGMLDETVPEPRFNEAEWPRDEDSPEYAAREAEHQRLVVAVAERPTGIPPYKLGSNDGWLVTPEEIRAALERLDEARVREVVPADELDYWSQWIGYLNRAAQCGGFRVH